MTRPGLLVGIAISVIVAGCGGSPAAPCGSCVGLFAAGKVNMTFTPQEQEFAEAAEAYRRLWVDEGSKIVEAMELVSGLTFREKDVKAVIFEGPSRSGSGDQPMYLRASYPTDVKKGALVHENGHRLIAQLTNRPRDLDEHRVLFLFLYDVYETLWGKDFADRQVTFDRGLRGIYDYDGAWTWALSISKHERASRFAAIVADNRR